MMRKIWTTGVAMAAAVMMVACSSTPQTPTSPSAGIGSSTNAAADGSTLKVTAPSLLDPTGEARVDTRRPTLAWTESTGTYTSGVSPSYEVEVSTGGTVVYNVTVDETTHQVDIEADFDTAYSWRVRARLDGAAGPWSAPATFLSPLAGGGGGFRTPDPPPGSRLPLPNESAIVFDEFNNNRDDWQNSCQERLHERGWIWLDKLVDRLRMKDLRWGYNGKRGNVNDPSLDVIDYHHGAGDSQGSTAVYIIDVLFQHCGNSPSPAWLDQTSATAESRSIGRWMFPRPGRIVAGQ